MPYILFHIPFYLVLAFSVTIFGIFGCHTNSQIKNIKPAVLLYKAKQFSREKDYFSAKKFFTQVLEDFPDSRERVEAQMLLADTLMKKKEYEEAKLNYQNFIELYPAWSNVDHAHFYMGMADFMMIDIASRDQSFTRSALFQFKRLIKNFPKSSYRKRAEAKIKKCQNKLAENILEIGRFYFRIHAYQSAIKRLKSLLGTYPNQKFNDEAVFLLAESYFNEQNYKEAQTFYSQLLDQYPRSSFIQEARLRLRVLR